MFEMETMYREIGIRKSVLDFGKKIEERLSERFQEIDKIAEYNQLKVIHAMQEKRVSADCFHYASGYGYDDHGRDTLEEVMRQFSIPRAHWYVHRLPVERMPWLWRLALI